MPPKSFAQQEEIRREFMRQRQVGASASDSSTFRVYELLRAGLRDGSISGQEQLSEHVLVKTYGASRNSVRRALQMLADQGLVSRERRTGTNVTHEFTPVLVGEIGPRAWTGTSYAGRLVVDTIACTQITLSPELRRRMATDSDQAILIEQVGSVDGAPHYYRLGYVLTDLSPTALMQVLEELHLSFPPLHEAFERCHGRPFGHTAYSLEAVTAEGDVADHLQVPAGTPTILRELLTTGADDQSGELSFTYFASGRVALSGRMDG